ncbi:hypothetical protein UFOVP858_23 [uncultured Caudovirales phage]|uniref:Uncharacterized protein n=1 Tax=uncultured Caudovirales phage TaxID=2100421 RepID=A0A6J5P665_9CAUD|nr:hypothetical protein UFOVP858_23 [uncultured Caudovirales phage]
MTNTIDTAVFAEIATRETSIANLKGEAKERTVEANGQKIGAYSALIAGLSSQKLVKGNLPRAIAKQVYKGLIEDAGVKEATAKRYLENSVGAIRALDIPTQATPALVKAILDSENIDSENKLAKLVSGETDKDPMQTMAEALVGKFTSRKDDDGNRVQGVFKPSKYEQEDWDRFEDALRELKAARVAASDAARQAEIEAQKANDMANEVFNSL